MKKILSLLLLTVSTSLYPYIIQTVVLKNKTSDQRVVLYGDVHERNMLGHSLFSDSEDEQINIISDRLKSLAASQEVKERLFLLEDMTLSPTGDNHAFTLEEIKKKTEALNLDLRNVDVRYTYYKEAAYLGFIEGARIMLPHVFGEKTDEEIVVFMQGEPQLNAALESIVKTIKLDTIDLGIIRNRLLSIMTSVSAELRDHCQNNEYVCQKLLVITSDINARIELIKQGKLSILSFLLDTSLPDHLDVKAAYEILSTDKKYVIGFMGLLHVAKISEILQDSYDIEYQSVIETSQGTYQQAKDVVPMLQQIQIKGVKTEDFDYIR